MSKHNDYERDYSPDMHDSGTHPRPAVKMQYEPLEEESNAKQTRSRGKRARAKTGVH